MANKIIKGDTVKIISGANKGTTGKVERVLPQKNAVLIEGLGVKHRRIKPSQLNPAGAQRDIHVPVALSKIALVIDEKSAKTSRVGRVKKVDGKGYARIARQANNKEIK